MSSDRSLELALRIKADLNGAVQDIAQLETKVEDLGSVSKTTAQNLAAVGKSADDIANKVKQVGAVTESSNKALTAQSAALQKTSQATGDLQQSMQPLPGQIAEVAEGLESGQSLFEVAAKKGAQLAGVHRDLLPVVGAAAGALSAELIIVSAGAAAFGLIGAAIYKANQEQRAFELANITTGGAIGATAGELVSMAFQVGELTGQYGDAQAAALQLAQSGKITADALAAATTGAVSLAQLTGDSIENTAELMVKLAEKPTEMLAQLNQQYHFLTPEVYEHVRALEDQGKMEDAARIAIEAFSSVHEQRVLQAEQSAGLLAKAWRAIGDTISTVWHTMQDDARSDFEHQLDAARLNLQALQKLNPNGSLEVTQWDAEVKRLEAIVAQEKNRAAAEKARQDANDKAIKASQDQQKAEKEWDRLKLSNLDKEQKLEQQIADIRKLGAAAGKSQADIDAQVAQARQRYADSLPKGRTSTKKSDADLAEQAASRDLANLTQQSALLDTVAGGEKKVSEEARVRYEIEQGSYKDASAATKQQLIDQAQLLDAKRKDREETEAAQQAYDRLRETLRTPAEAAVGKAKEEIDVLNNALERGIGNASSYQADVGRAISSAFTAAPEFNGLSAEVGGVNSEEYRLEQAGKKLDDWRAEQLERLNQFRSQQIGTEQQWNAEQLRIDQETAQKRGQIQQAEQQLIQSQVTSGFDSLLDAARNFAGEQSEIYRVLFAISKGFAVSQAAVSLAVNVAKASEAGFPQNLVFMAGAFAQGAQILQLLSAARYATGGAISGPGTGTSDSIPIWASDGEFMVRERAASQPGAQAFLYDFNSRGMAALQDWRGFADGGLISSAQDPGYRVNGGGGAGPSINNRMRVYLLQDENALAERLAKHPATEKAVIAIAGQNGTAIRAEW